MGGIGIYWWPGGVEPLIKTNIFAIMENICRPIYTTHILRFLDKGMIIALTGQRRVGKSFILQP